MARWYLLIISFLIFSPIQSSFSQDQGYLGGLVSALNKSHSAEAMASLGAYKTTLIGCLAINSGSESSCVTAVNFSSTKNFDYSFSLSPKDGSQAWVIKASGKGDYAPGDSVFLTSDENGRISCSSAGKMANSC